MKYPKGKKFCPNCGAEIKKSRAKWVSLFLAVAILGICAAGVLEYFKIVDIPVVSSVVEKLGAEDDKAENDAAVNATTETDTTESNTDIDITASTEPYSVEQPDADEYFNKNSDVISKIAADESTTVQSEAQAVSILTARGFTEYPISTEYSMTGEYIEETEISQDSDTKHPIYQTLYINSNNDVWTIFLVEDRVMAYPVSYNTQSSSSTDVILSETDSLISYDGTTNQFYETIPKESEIEVKKIEQITSETLEKLSDEEIDKL